MDYKKIIRSQSVRFTILKALSWVPDFIMLPLQYKIKLGRWPNLNHPRRYTEKLQLYKMRYRNPVMHKCVDKYEVRKFVEDKGLGSILVPLFCVCEDAKDIKLEELPSKFVIKTTDGTGGNNVLVCKDKNRFNWDDVVKKVNSWKDQKDVNPGREWAYTGIKKSRIIVEEYLDGGDRPLVDYKFFCFNGEPQMLYVITDREPGKYAFLGIYDMDFNKLPVYRCDERRQVQIEAKPDNYDEMVEIARLLSSGFPHVRVDLYNVKGKIYFGELTFYDGSGYFGYDPDEFDFEMGSYFTEY